MRETETKPLVLFLCTANSARSQMAESILRARAGDQFAVASAGMEPTSVHPLTIQALREAGFETDGLYSKPTSEFLGKVKVWCAIIVCEHANRQCPSVYPFATKTLYWPFDDPAAAPGTDIDRLAKFRQVRDSIVQRIDQWLLEMDEAP